ncbi:glycosyltransferase family 4 protein [Xiashengella succiniciproducens]|jgi:starch synthase|uniref:Glycosyltransferase family 4 protein n=1 Tax=Xiashengella succiniciproducens TaxID=2949635 RepID=A0A9J6ZS79_9BACT|nr:glycosyltransferase family 4 protein [Alkaliflexus sp. Ai-910]URW80788.1 glycosyltransferase family 4 protein [Alkaliflexus sp. Ai-910]
MCKAKIVLSHSGKQHSYQVARALDALGMLDRFYTSSYITNKKLQQWLISRNDQYWTRRFVKGLGGSKVSANWRFELPEVFWRLKEGKSPRAQRAVYRRDEQFDAYVAARLKRHHGAKVFWGFQGSCHSSLKTAHVLGMEAWCELATAHVTAAQRILGEEARLQPKWAETIDNLIFPAAYQKRLEEEPHLATKVLAASEFTKNTLLEVGIAAEKIDILPLGCDIEHVPYLESDVSDFPQRPLRVLYAGTLTQRKGLSYLLEAMVALKQHVLAKEVEFHFIGGIQGNTSLIQPYLRLMHYHNPISQTELFKRYNQYDVLLLPTIFEGFGLVIVEAMAAGLPVITTPHSIGPELINNGSNGFIIPIRDARAIEKAIIKIRNMDSDSYMQMRKAARKAAENYSWQTYSQRLEAMLLREDLI